MITKLRAGMAVKRFHTHTRLVDETVGHHSANVCAILIALDPNVSRELLLEAILHDVAEAHTGDVPAPAKWACPVLKAALDDAEDDYIMQSGIPRYYLTLEDTKLLKAADMLDLILSSTEEVNRGNKYAEKLVSNGWDYIMGLGLAQPVMNAIKQMIEEVHYGCQ